MPSLNNFEKVGRAVSEAVNKVNIKREDGAPIDLTDLSENYDDFSIEKYEAVLRGERRYRYLKFEKYWYQGEQRIHAIVTIPDSPDGKYAVEYLEFVLKTLKVDYRIDTSRVNSAEMMQMTRDVNEIGRFTCIKFLRLVWAIFSDEESDAKGLFPQVYQMPVVDAGDLSRQVDGDEDLFNPNKLNMTRPSHLKYANISNYNPDSKIEMFDNKVVVFFRPTDKKTYAVDNGHVGVGRLTAQYDASGKYNGFTISFIEVLGTTGQAFYRERVALKDFRTHLYFNTPSADPLNQQIIGWYLNR